MLEGTDHMSTGLPPAGSAYVTSLDTDTGALNWQHDLQEYVGTRNAARGDRPTCRRFPADLADVAEELIRLLPHVRFADTHQRGYMVCHVTETGMVTRYQVAGSTLVPDSPVTTAGTWTTLAGTPGVQPA